MTSVMPAPDEHAARPDQGAPRSLVFVSSLRRWGGGEKWMAEAAAAMRRRGHRVTMIVQPGAVLGDRARDLNLEVFEVRLGGWLDPRSLHGLAGVLRHARAEVIVANLDKEIRQARLAAIMAGRRVRLVARRGSPDAIKDNWHYRLAYQFGVDRLICNADALVAQVCGQAPWFDRNKVRVIPNGIDVDAVRRAADGTRVRQELGLAPDTVVVSCVGEVGWRKGQEHVLAAAQRLRSLFGDAVWLIAGEGEGLEDLRLRARSRGLDSHGYVRFLGFRRDVTSILAASQILVLPSRREGFPNTLLEGMALGLPVAASRADGIPELVVHGKTGFLHAIDDRESFVDDCEHLLGDPDLRRRFGIAGQERAASVFAQGAVMDRVEGVLAGW